MKRIDKFINSLYPSNRHFKLVLEDNSLSVLKDTVNYRLSNVPVVRNSLSRYLRDNVVPELSSDASKNSLRIAVCSAFVKSHELDVQTRVNLGLPKIPQHEFPQCSPTLLNPYEHRELVEWTCDESEVKLKNVADRVEWGPDIQYRDVQNTYPFVMFNSLVGKADGYVMGYCNRVVEFPNGTLLVPGTLYLLSKRGGDDTVELIQRAVWEAHQGTLVETEEIFFDNDSSNDPQRRILSVNPRQCMLAPVRGLFADNKVDNEY